MHEKIFMLCAWSSSTCVNMLMMFINVHQHAATCWWALCMTFKDLQSPRQGLWRSLGGGGYLNNPSRVFSKKPWKNAVGGGGSKMKRLPGTFSKCGGSGTFRLGKTPFSTLAEKGRKNLPGLLGVLSNFYASPKSLDKLFQQCCKKFGHVQKVFHHHAWCWKLFSSAWNFFYDHAWT